MYTKVAAIPEVAFPYSQCHRASGSLSRQYNLGVLVDSNLGVLVDNNGSGVADPQRAWWRRSTLVSWYNSGRALARLR